MRLALITTDNREDRRDYSPSLPWFGTAPQSLLDGFATLAGEIEVHVLSCTRAHLRDSIQLGPNITFHSIHVPSWAWLKTAYLGNILAIRKRLAQIRPDLVHGQGTERDCALAAVFSGYDNLITIHGNMRCLAQLSDAAAWSFLGLTSFLESVAIRRAGGVICLSTHTQTLAAPTARRTWIIPNAVDPRFSPAPQKAGTTAPKIILVGDLLPNKNQLAFLNAIAGLHAESGFTVQLIGKFQPHQSYAASILEFAASHPWCECTPFLDRVALARIMAEATLLVLPSLEENLPMVILEAMASGLPVAASNVGGIPDLITDRKTGMLFDPTDPESMKQSVRLILEDDALRSQLARDAHQQVLDKHQPITIASRHLEIYRHFKSSSTFPAT